MQKLEISKSKNEDKNLIIANKKSKGEKFSKTRHTSLLKTEPKRLLMRRSLIQVKSEMGMSSKSTPKWPSHETLGVSRGQSILQDSAQTEQLVRTNLKFKSKVTKSKVVLVSNLDCSDFRARDMMALVSCFGNVKKLLLMANLKKCLVEFKSIAFAQSCLVLLNNQFFRGEKLKVNFSKYSRIDLKKNGKSDNSERFNEVRKARREDIRIPAKIAVTFLPPSRCILICTQTRKGSQGPSQEKIYNFFAKLAYKPNRIRVCDEQMAKEIKKEYKKRGFAGPRKGKVRAIYRFKNLPESMFVLSKAHGRRVCGALLDISFSFFGV